MRDSDYSWCWVAMLVGLCAYASFLMWRGDVLAEVSLYFGFIVGIWPAFERAVLGRQP